MPQRPAELDDRAAAERAYVAFRYLLGARRPNLLKDLRNPTPEACRLANALSHNERHRRAAALAEGLTSVAEALSRTRFTWR